MSAYYNEFDPYAAQWLRNLISAGHLPAGDVDERSIVDVGADDLVGYAQCHFFAGIGGWPLAARLAGWPDGREIWTGSCPCQPFSAAGNQRGTDDARHLWPDFFRLIRARRPAVVMGEQVAAAVGKDWLDGVHADLESIGYAGGAAIVPACAVDAPHRRDRLWFVGSRVLDHADNAGLEGFAGHDGGARGRKEPGGSAAAASGSNAVADSDEIGREQFAPSWVHGGGSCGDNAVRRSPWCRHEWRIGHDGKARRVPETGAGIRLLADGVSARMGRLRAYGNAIVPQVAAEMIAAYMESAA